MRCIFTIGMTPFSIATIGANGPSVWRIVSVCVYLDMDMEKCSREWKKIFLTLIVDEEIEELDLA